MGKIISIYFLTEVCIVILAIMTYVFIDKRYKKKHGTTVPKGFEKTEEITIDPSNGKRLRVYYNSQTGERFYCEEKK